MRCVWLLLLLCFAPRALAIALDDETKILDSYSLEAQGEQQAAIKKMTSVLIHNKDNYFVNLRLGWLFSQVKKYKNSIDHYETAARLSPNALEPLLGLSLVQFNLGDFAAAAAVSEKILQKDPKNYVGHIRFVASQLKLKEFSSALGRIETAAKYYPTDAVLLEQRGFTLMQLGRVPEAKKTLQDLLLVSPTNAYAKSVLGDLVSQ